MSFYQRIVLSACAELAAITAQAMLHRLHAPKKLWIREWLAKKNKGVSKNLLPELKKGDPNGFKKFSRMSPQTFDILLSKIGPGIRKETTNMREPISPITKLEIVLHYLATGEDFGSSEFNFRVSDSCISSFLPEVLKEIIHKLEPDYLKVNSELKNNNSTFRLI